MRYTRITRFLALAVLVAVGTGCGGGKKRAAQSNQLHQFGAQKLADGNAEGAVADLTGALRLDPENPEIEHSLGLAYWAKSRVLKDDSLKVEAEKHILSSFKLKKDEVSGDWRNNLGALYVDMDRWADAVVHLEKALKDPEYRTPERPLNNLSKASFEQRKYKEAFDYADRALRVQPRFCMALVNRGHASRALKKTEDANLDFVKVAQECPEYVEAWFHAGITYFELGKKNDAKRYLMETKARDPEGKWGREAEKLLRKMGSGG